MKLTVLGPGCWGLTLAWLLTDNFEDITVWGRAQDLTEDLLVNKHCSKPLEVQLADKIEITSDLAAAIKDADIILSVDATSGTRDVCEHLKAAGIRPEQILVNASKGIELPSLMRMSEVIKDVINMFVNQINNKEVEINFQDKGNKELIGDRDKFYQMMLNLVENAIKYCNGKAIINIKTYKNKDYEYIEIEDNGVGIPSEDLPRIFERFYRVDKSRSRGGTGLGLAIVKHIVKMFNGEVYVDSVLNKGTKFTIKIRKTKKLI